MLNDSLSHNDLVAEANFPADRRSFAILFEIPTLITHFFQEYSFGSDVCDKVKIHWGQIFQVDSRQYGSKTFLFFDVFSTKRRECYKDRHILGQSMTVLLLQNMFFLFQLGDRHEYSKIPKYCSVSFSSLFLDFPVHFTEYKLV